MVAVPDVELPKIGWQDAEERLGSAYPRRIEHLPRVPAWMVGHLRVSRGAVFLEQPHMSPGDAYAFIWPFGPDRASVVVCRERGDLEWPVWLRVQRLASPAVGRKIVRDGLRDALDYIGARPGAARQRRPVVATFAGGTR